MSPLSTPGTPESERREAARERLTAALAPQTNRERYLVDWLLGCLIADEADEWSTMIERGALTAGGDST